MRAGAFVLVLAVAVAVAACGGGDGGGHVGPGTQSGSCDLAALSECREYGGFTQTGIDAQKKSCMNGAGAWADGGCPRAQAAGACRSTTMNGTTTTWYYTTGPFKTPSDVSNLCQQSNQEFIAP
jgi:hypothetical protein